MPLLDFEGFESLPQLRTVWSPTVTPVPRTGRNGVGKAMGTDGASGNATLSFPSTAATIVVGFAYQVANATVFNSQTAPFRLLVLEGDNGAAEHLSFNFTADAKLQVRRGNGAGTILATTPAPVGVVGDWHHFEVKATISDTVGIVQVRIDGVQVINFTGDTKNAGTALVWSGLEISVSPVIFYDDMFIIDASGAAPNDFIGDHKIVGTVPNGNGAESDFMGSDADSVDNYLLVDDSNVVDYVSSGTSGDRDLYAHSDLSGPAPTVLAVRQSAYVFKTDAGDRSIKFVARSAGATEVVSAAVPVTVTPALVSGPVMTADADAAAWTASNLNSHQFGVEVA